MYFVYRMVCAITTAKGRRGGFCWREWTMSFTAGRPAVSGQLMRRPPRPWRDDDGRP